MGSEEVFASSIGSISLSASGSGSVYSYLNGIHKNDITSTDINSSFNLNDEQLKLKIIKFWKYEIPTVPDDGSLGWANFGIGLFNFFTFSDYDFPYHWFLIGVTEEYKDKDGKNKELFYLIEKTQNGKDVKRFDTENEIKNKEKEVYKEDTTFLETKYLKLDITIEIYFII